jgi:hypothetical protein
MYLIALKKEKTGERQVKNCRKLIRISLAANPRVVNTARL